MSIARLHRFIADMTSLVGGAWQDRDEAAIVEVGRTLLADLVKHDDWLPTRWPGVRRTATRRTCCGAIPSSASRS
jgi:predicted metal-dependent enzyme (double-stranded beta helix superfamily)